MRSFVVRLLALSTLVAAAACDGDGTGGSRLTPADVAGVYRVCTLRFVPDNSAFPAANLLERVVHTTPPAGKPEPTVTVSPVSAEYQLSYTRRVDNFTRELLGGVSFGADDVRFRFYADQDNPSVTAAELLLPAEATLAFQSGPKRLTTTGARTYSVARREYARAAGVDESGFAATIPGRLDLVLRENTCS
jgi:hypothetical protein